MDLEDAMQINRLMLNPLPANQLCICYYYTVDGGLYAEELSLSADVVDDYDRRRDAVLM